MSVLNFSHWMQNALAVTIFAFSVQLAQATPPRYASVHDTPVAINETHIFVFRVLGDNEGSHYISANQRFLVAQSLQTGKVDHIWPLDQTRLTFVEIDARTYEYRRAEPRVDLLDILDRNSTVPLTITARSIWSGNRIKVSDFSELTQKGIIDTVSGNIRVEASDIQARIAASLVPFMDFLIDDPGPTAPLTFDANAYSHDLADCFVVGLYANIDGHDTYQLNCENGEYEVLTYVIYLTIPNKD